MTSGVLGTSSSSSIAAVVILFILSIIASLVTILCQLDLRTVAPVARFKKSHDSVELVHGWRAIQGVKKLLEVLLFTSNASA
jgi:hypothetical protein